MRSSNVVKTLAVVFGCTLLAGSVGLAEDTKGKWQFGFGLSYFSTSDSIRSNADVAIAGEELGEEGLPPVVFVDPRPDDNVLNEPSIQDDFRFDLSASYGLTRWLALEVWGSYMKAPVGDIEVYVSDVTVTPGDGNPTQGGTVEACGPTGTDTCFTYSAGVPLNTRINSFVPVGELTQIPIHLSALFRFRPESPFDPYIGAGIGYIFTDMELSSEFQAVSQEIASRDLAQACGGEISYCGGDSDSVQVPAADLNTAFKPEALTVEVDDAFEWHLVAGVDYYMSERYSIYVDARYSWASGQVDIKSSDFHQVQITATDEGRLFFATQSVWDEEVGVNPNDPLYGAPYYWEDQGPLVNADFHGRCPECVGNGLFNTEDKNGNGLYEAFEDDGMLIALPPGSADPNEAIVGQEIYCAGCDGNGPGPQYPGQVGIYLVPDTEDVNYSRSLDRFLNYGIDICTTPQGVGHPACEQSNLGPTTADRYVLPAGCPTIVPAVDVRVPEGCPTPVTGPSTNLVDNTTDNFTVQGGEIRYDGFALGVGFKMTF